jgi:urease accessory protein
MTNFEIHSSVVNSTKNKHTHDHSNSNEHGHTHDFMETPGSYILRDPPRKRNWKERAFTIGIGGYKSI